MSQLCHRRLFTAVTGPPEQAVCRWVEQVVFLDGSHGARVNEPSTSCIKTTSKRQPSEEFALKGLTPTAE